MTTTAVETKLLTPGRAALAGLVVGAALVGALAGLGWPPAGDAGHGGAAPAEFLAQWRRSRMATWVVESTFSRTTARGGDLRFTVHNAQRPPDRLLSGFGSVSARQGDQLLACAGGQRGPSSLRCRRSAGAPPWVAEVDDEMRLLESYLEGEPPLYRVTRSGPGCFQLSQARPMVSAPYGSRALFCFDAATGAPSRSEITRPEGSDVTRAFRVSATVTDADLAPPAR